MNEIREAILEMVSDQVGLDQEAYDDLVSGGRLDELTAVDSLLMVELVLSIEERFHIRFDPEDIDAGLIGDIDRLAEFVRKAVDAG